MKKIYFGLFTTFLSIFSYSQEECGFDRVNQSFLRENPLIRQQMEATDARIARDIMNGTLMSYRIVNGFIEIPVVVHVFSDGRNLGTLGNRSDEQIIEWINYTNNLYAGTAHTDRNGAVYPFKLVLAKRTIDNQPTNGIVRTDLSNNSGYVQNGLNYYGTSGISEETAKSLSRWNPKYFYNIYVFNKIDGFDGTSGGGTNGFAYLHGAAGGSNDGAFHHAGVVGVNKATLGHEIGHALGLYHVFGNASNTCEHDVTSNPDPYTTGDYVHDTSPTINGNHYTSVFGTNQPIGLINTCTNQVFDNIIWNVLNYGNQTRSLFTQGQVDRSVQLFNEYRSSFNNSLGTQLPSSVNLTPVSTTCIPGNASQGNYGMGMELVSFGDIYSKSNSYYNNSSSYTDYTQLANIDSSYSTEVYTDNTYTITLGTSSLSTNRYEVFIDYNNNGNFEETERVVTNLTLSGQSYDVLKTVTANITIPSTSTLNTPLRMRVIGDSNSSSVSFAACDNRYRGEVEDYVIIVKQTQGCEGVSENITANLSDIGNGTILLKANGIGLSSETSVQWEVSTDNVTWTEIVNANSINYNHTVTGLIGDINYYRLKVTCNENVTYSSIISHQIQYCGAGASNSSYEKISNVTFGEINNNSTSTLGYEDFTEIKTNVFKGQTLNFSASYNNQSYSSDEVIVWIDYNQDGNFDSSEKVLTTQRGLSPWLGTISIPSSALSGETRMRVRLHDTSDGPNYNACGNSTYGQVEDYTINILSDTTTWNGSTWSNGEPDGSKKVIVNGALEINTDIISKELTVNEGGSVVVKAGKTLNVSGKITNNSTADKFIVESGGHVIQTSNTTNEGQFTVQRNSDLMVRNDMTLWSSPVSGQNVRSFSPETLENRFWTYREDTDLFSQLFTTEGENKASSSYNFEPGKGVSIRVRNTLPTGQSEAFAGTFVGTLNNGDIFVPITKMLNGYNLVGNPYPSSINSAQFIYNNPSISALYFWSHKYPVGHANYNLNYDSYTIAGSSSGDLSTIATGQGFIVKSDSNGVVNFTNILRNNLPAEFNRSTEIERNRIWLGLNKNEELQNQILVAYMTNATNEFDHQIDGKRMQGGGTQLYTLLNNDAYAIQGRQLPFNTEDVVKLGLEVAQAGTLSISLNAVDGLFEDGQEVYILDKSTNTIHNLSASAYQFESEAGTFNERFEVLYTNRNLSTTDLKSDDIKVYKNGETFVVESAKAKIISIELVDVQGRKLFSESKLNTNRFEVNTAAKGVLIIKVATEDGQIKTQKVIK